MKLFLNSFHTDHYQAMFVSSLYDSPGSWSKNPLSQPPLISKHPGPPHSLLCNSLGHSPFAKLHQISTLALHFPVFWGHSHFQQQECAVKKQTFPLPVFSQTCHLADTQVIPMCGDSPSFSIAFNRSNIHYPRVSISGTYDLREILKGLGVADGFINRADLSGIAGKVIL